MAVELKKLISKLLTTKANMLIVEHVFTQAV